MFSAPLSPIKVWCFINVIKHAYRLTIDLLGMAKIRVPEWVSQDTSVYEIPPSHIPPRQRRYQPQLTREYLRASVARG